MPNSALGNGNGSALRLKQLYDEASQLARIGAWQCLLDREELTWTGGVYDLFELPRGAPLHRPAIVDMYHLSSRLEMEQLRADAIKGQHGFILDARIETERHATRWMRLTGSVECRGGCAVRLFGTKQDITREKELFDRLRQLAECDPLTGLANRAVFEARFDELTKAGDNAVSALALVDFDRFKHINDRFGHAVGDECLRRMAERLPRAFDTATLIARIGGDEFAILLAGRRGPVAFDIDLRRALRVLCRPIFWNGIRVDAGASIGVAPLRRWPRPELGTALAEADAALYAAKAAGRSTACVFGEGENGGMHPGAPQRLRNAGWAG